MKDRIKKIISGKNSKSFPRLLKNHPDLMVWIDHQTASYNAKSVNEKLYIIFVTPPEIKSCGNTPLFSSYEKGYRQFCGPKKTCACAAQHQSKIIKEHQSNVSQDERNRRLKKAKQTNIKKWGYTNPALHPDVKAKTRQTNLERWGSETPLGSDIIQEKVQKTNLEKYGVNYPLQSPEIQEKTKHTLVEKYGNDYMKIARDAFAEQNNNINPFVVYRDKITSTLQLKYGVDHPSKSSKIYQKSMNTLQSNHGVKNPSQIHIPSESYAILENEKIFTELCEQHSLNELCDILNVSATVIWNRHDKYGLDIFDKKSRSQYEEEIAAWLDSIGVSYTRNKTIANRKTVDFLINNIAIEFNGLYAHSINSHYGKLLGIDKNYHYNKWLMCNNAGIQLYTIFEDEWNKNKNAFKNKIKASLGLLERGDSARKCTISKINHKTAHDFLNTYHIQGAANGTVYYGAIDKSENLVAVIVFKKTTNKTYELNRYCNDDKSHSGLFTKMLMHFEREYCPEQIISFSDNRYSDGGVYRSNGFVHSCLLNPDYTVTDYTVREHKFNWRKNRIKSRFGVCTENKTEWQLTQELGYDRIYDCGKIKWIKKGTP